MTESTLSRLTRARDILVKLRKRVGDTPFTHQPYFVENGIYRGGELLDEDGNSFCENITDAEGDEFVVLHAALPALIQVLDAAETVGGLLPVTQNGVMFSAALALADKVIGAAG